jgi:hypothetical protein
MRKTLHDPVRLVRLTVVCAVVGCVPDHATEVAGGAAPDARATAATASAARESPGVHRQYGPPVKLGDGKVRAYVVLDAKAEQRPLELGVAIDARAIEGTLPSPDMLMLPMTLPAQAPAPYRFVLLDWNPLGHPPAGVSDVPHFDFHFFLVPRAEVEAITRDDPSFAAKADNLPTGAYLPPLYAVSKPPGATPALVAVPGMGVHWQDLLSPEYQRILGRPEAYRPFTKTYVYVSWDGRMTALEPMITREYLLRRQNETVQVRQPAKYPEAGWYPGAYRIEYDDRTSEYRIALVDFAWHE